MKLKTIGVLSFGGVAMSFALAWAGLVGVQRSPSDQQSAVIAQLEVVQQQDRHQAQLSNARGPLLIRYMDKNAQLQDLIDRIQAGQPVSPDEIDQASQPISH